MSSVKLDRVVSIYEFMQKQTDAQVNSDVDALTVTAKSLEGRLCVDLVVENLTPLFSDERKKHFSFRGATGYSRGSLRYAVQRNSSTQEATWVILMVTGDNSRKALDMVVNYEGVKYTRVDLFVDVKMKESVAGLAKMMYELGRINRTKRLISSPTGDTLYVGSRESDVYIRVYDKSEEYDEELGSVWRFELEAKGEFCGAVIEDLVNGMEIDDIVFGVCDKCGVPVPKGGTVPKIKRKALTLRSPEASINWLSRQVRPTIEYLVSIGKAADMFEALGLEGAFDKK